MRLSPKYLHLSQYGDEKEQGASINMSQVDQAYGQVLDQFFVRLRLGRDTSVTLHL